jgi:hypothetical protein
MNQVHVVKMLEKIIVRSASQEISRQFPADTSKYTTSKLFLENPN